MKLLATLILLILASPAPVLADPFLFRGQLEDGASKAQGHYALRLTLYAHEGAGERLAGPLELLDVAVADGQFAEEVDFGELPWHLDEGWLEVAVKAGDAGNYVALGERARVALKATEACPAAWALGGNALTNPTVNFLGTTDAQPLLVRSPGGVGVQRAGGANLPEAALHVFDGAAGAATITNSVAVLENDASAFMTLLAPNASERGVLFGDPENVADGGIVYNGTDAMQFRTSGNNIRMTLDGEGDLGIGTGTGALTNRLTVVGNALSANPANASRAIVQIRDTELFGVPRSLLALKAGPVGSLSTDTNFIRFFDGADAPMGVIQGNGTGGVQYATSGADYAEWLPRVDASEVIAPGDVVGLHEGGKVSKKFAGALRAVVASTGAAVAGNHPGEGATRTHSLIAFLGQVQARICGPVRAGDAILASDDDSGCGIARDPAQLTAAELVRVAGTAWDAVEGAGEHRVRVAVGLGTATPVMARLTAENATLRSRLDALEAQRAHDRAELAALREAIAPALALERQ